MWKDAPHLNDIRAGLGSCMDYDDVTEEEAMEIMKRNQEKFDRMAADVVWNKKQLYPSVQSILVLPYLDRAVDVTAYDGTIYPPLEKVPRRFAISRRNEWMVDYSDVVVAYVIHEWGGAATTLRYAIKKKKVIMGWKRSCTSS